MKHTNHWFPFFWNDYLNDTLHLTMLQHGAYLGCLLACYRSGSGLPSDLTTIFRIVGAVTNDEQKAVTFILENFFKKQDDNSYRHSRVDFELKDRERRNATAIVRAQAGAKARWGKSSEHATSTATSMLEALPQAINKDAQTQTQTQTDPQTDFKNKDLSSQNEKSDGQAVSPSLPARDSLSSKSKATPLTLEQIERRNRAEMLEAREKANKTRWNTEFKNNTAIAVPDSMRYALPTDEECVQLLAQIDELGIDEFSEAVSEWESAQSPPISSLRHHRWKIWLETCAAKLDEHTGFKDLHSKTR